MTVSRAWLQSTLQLMAAEAKQPQPGGETVLTRLADILAIQAICAWLARDPAAQTGWLGALQDRQIGRPLLLFGHGPAWWRARARATLNCRAATAGWSQGLALAEAGTVFA